MRCLLLFPPQWIPFSPHLAGPAIASIIKNHGHQVELIDLNAEFYNTVLTPEFLSRTLKEAFRDFDANAAALLRQCPDPAELKKHPPLFQVRYERFRKIYEIARQNEYNEVIQRIGRSVAILRDKNAFYDVQAVDRAMAVINKACAMLSAAHHPSNVYFLTPNVKIYYTLDSLVQDCTNEQGNIFHGFITSRILGLLEKAPEMIGISIGDYSQLLPGLTLAMLLKKASKTRICIGGNLFGRYTDVLVNNPDFFKGFADFIIYNEGERPVLALLQHLAGQLPIADVPNLIYLQADGRIAINGEQPPLPVTELSPPDFSDLTPHSYFLPEVIYNIQASRSCYWRKCAFCTHHAGSRYAVKPVAGIIEEIRHLQKEHGAKYFHFIDEAVSPAYLRALSRGILEAGLDIHFYLYARFEKDFSEELFRLAQQAGLRMVLWGFEAASARVYSLMNKGPITDKGERLQILKSAHAAGVWNFLFLMFHFPTETFAEAKETVDFVRDNGYLLSHGTGGTFMLLGDSPMLKDLQKYSITSVQKVRNGFNFAHKFTTDRGITGEQRKELAEYKGERWRMAERQCRASHFREKLFLYVCKYGVDGVSEMNRDFWL